MSHYKGELAGREFDWFAIDGEGNIGLFSTAGEGRIPETVIENYVQYDNVSALFDSPNWGTSEVWSDYAKLGFYVYDWILYGGPYKKERDPMGNMSAELKTKIMAIASLPKLPVKFKEQNEIMDV